MTTRTRDLTMTDETRDLLGVEHPLYRHVLREVDRKAGMVRVAPITPTGADLSRALWLFDDDVIPFG